jgi:hypothetical protein
MICARARLSSTNWSRRRAPAVSSLAVGWIVSFAGGLLFHGVGNALFHQLMDIFWAMYTYFPTAQGQEEHTGLEDAQRHRSILEAIRAGDVELARQRSREKFDVGIARYQQTLPRVSETAGGW